MFHINKYLDMSDNDKDDYYTHMPMGKVWIYRLLFVCCLFVCTDTNFSAEDKASGVTFCSVFHRRLKHGITNFCEICSPRNPKSDEAASARATPTGM